MLGALAGEGQGHVARPVGDGAVADLHMDGVDEHHRTDRVEGAVLPFGHALEGLVGDRGDRLAGDVGAIDLGQVGLDLAGGQALRGQRDDRLVHAGQALLPLLDDLRLEGSVAVTRHGYLHRADVGEHGLRAGAVARVAAVPPCRIVLVIAEMVGDLALQGGLQQPLRQLLEQSALADRGSTVSPIPAPSTFSPVIGASSMIGSYTERSTVPAPLRSARPPAVPGPGAYVERFTAGASCPRVK